MGMKVAALVLAAGRGERLGHSLPKAFVPLAGRTLVERSIDVLASVPEVDAVVVVLAAEDRARFETLFQVRPEKLLAVVVGGTERQDSVAAGVASLPEGVEIIAVHDAARCLVSRQEVSAVIAVARERGAALLAQPSRDTIKRVRDGVVAETPPRSECWSAATPQVFRAELLREALEKAAADGIRGTDDAQLVERLGVEVHVVEGSPRNLKITLPEDLAIAEAWLKARTGDGG